MISNLTIDVEQFLDDLQSLALIGGGDNGVVNRTAYSQKDVEGRRWVQQQLESLGIAYEVDAAGNTLALYSGRNPELPPIGVGSHSDTVPEGGRFDGSLGVLAALACLRTLSQAGEHLQHPLLFINFAAEEATMAGGTTGSMAMNGQLDPDLINKVAWDGKLVRTHLQGAGLEPEKILDAARPAGSLAAFFELHIEQSKRLETANVPIAIVNGFVSIRRYAVTIPGVANHAGTTPMVERQDALVRALPIIQAVNDEAIAAEVVATVGVLEVSPGAPNVIPGSVRFIVEMRSLDEAKLDGLAERLSTLVYELDGHWINVVAKSAAPCDPGLKKDIEVACDDLGLDYLHMDSGAGHDAMMMAALCPQAMLFIPSKDGISHSPDEYSSPLQCARGAQVLLRSLQNCDQRLAP